MNHVSRTSVFCGEFENRRRFLLSHHGLPKLLPDVYAESDTPWSVRPWGRQRSISYAPILGLVSLRDGVADRCWVGLLDLIHQSQGVFENEHRPSSTVKNYSRFYFVGFFCRGFFALFSLKLSSLFYK
jgi:hypothetical protein